MLTWLQMLTSWGQNFSWACVIWASVMGRVFGRQLEASGSGGLQFTITEACNMHELLRLTYLQHLIEAGMLLIFFL